MISQPLGVLAILFVNIWICEWLVNNTRLRPLSTALLVILLTAGLANIGLIPSATDNFPLYEGIFTYLAPISIFYLLLEVNLRNLRRAGFPMLLMFGIGALGTCAGVYLGMHLIDGPSTIGPLYNALGGMFTGTYTGGSVNFNAVALHYEMQKEGTLYAGAVAVDNLITALWMIATIGLPTLLSRWFPRKINSQQNSSTQVSESLVGDTEFNVSSLAMLALLGLLSLWLSNEITGWLTEMGIEIPSILILTTIALILAQIPAVQRLKGGRLLGMVCVYIFLAVIGAYCEIAALAEIGSLAVSLLIFAGMLTLVHGVFCYGIGGWLKYDWRLISIASQANIGGSSTALALAGSLGRSDLILPAILIGSLGNGIGTYLGFLMAGIL